MNFFVRLFINWLQALVRWYYSVRYGPVAKRLGGAGEPAGRGFIIVQIDGLGHETFLDAVTKGYMPYVAGLMRNGDGEAYRWFCGLPSTTPIVQAGIMYGNVNNLPGFRWFEKRSRTSLVCKYPGTMRRLQKVLETNSVGILTGGSSYTNMYDGGASNTLFTLASMSKTSLLQKVSGLGLFLVLLFSPIRVLRIIVLSLWTYILGVWRQLSSLFWPNKFGRLSLLAPFFHVLTDVVVREVSTFGALVDIYRGVSSIYINYSSYDEMAHRFGPTDHDAYWALKAIDRQIYQLDKMRRQGAGRLYDLYVLSDHGIAPCVPFEAVYGSSLGQLLSASVRQPALSNERDEAEEFDNAARLIESELATAEGRLPQRYFGLTSLLRRLLRKGKSPVIEENAGGNIIIRSSGPLSHVYFADSIEPLLLEHLEEEYTGLVHLLASHPGVAVVGVRSLDGPVLICFKGAFPCRPGLGEPAFEGLSDATLLVKDMERLLSFENSGDLVILGNWGVWGREDNVISFEPQAGTHGSVGGQQCYPFILAVGDQNLDFSHITNPIELYSFFHAYQKQMSKEVSSPESAPEEERSHQV